MDVNFSGKTALVTGAAGGIGAEICRQLIKCGAFVIATDLNEIDLGPNSQFIKIDLRDVKDIRKKCASLTRSVDFLVNCAGVALFEPIFETSEKAFDIQNDVNWKAPLFLSMILAEEMAKRGGGAIVNISSQSSKIALLDHLVYSTTKAAVDHMTRISAMELGPKGVRVNAVNPTVVMTPLAKKAWSKEGLEKMIKQIPVRQFAAPVDVAYTVCFLLSDYAKMINGVTLHVDGGYWFSKL